ncbi:MAG: hypothetical protein JW863_09980 [Chitinispirillaceae bacterium]|nr:hypothetical protein [Chitinispirillaceae bacterium]
MQNSLLILFLSTVSTGALPLPPDIHQNLIASIDYVFKEDFSQAENEAKRLIKKMPDHPAGYFCMAFVLDSWMTLYQSDAKENEFYRYCDQAIEKGEKILLKDKNDEWVRFFIGSADGFKGTYEARYERWITAFRYGWKGVSELMDLKNDGSVLPDINSGIGCYNYWRSAMMKALWWMPGIEDKRQESIELLQKVLHEALYTRTATAFNLIDILLNEKMFSEALVVADEVLGQYPESTVFLWGRARSLFGLKRYREAITVLERLVGKVEKMTPDNHYNSTLYYLHLAKSFLAVEEYDRSVQSCVSIRKFSYEPAIRKRLALVLDEVKSVEKAALRERTKNDR